MGGSRILLAGLVACVVLVGSLASSAGLAAAAGGPEAPITEAPREVRSTTAVLQGMVDPLAPATVSWFFEYRKGSVCTGGSATPMEGPEEVEARPVAAGVEGLLANTEYTGCLVAEDGGGQTAGSPVHFVTALPPEAPQTLGPAQSITATSAVFEGVLNPGSMREAGWYFVYSNPGGVSCVEGPATAEEKEEDVKAAHVRVTAAGLEPDQKYVFCLVATNEAGETAPSAQEVFFETPPSAPSVDGESVSRATAAGATLEAQVNPNNQETTYSFEYADNPALTDGTSLAGTALSGYGDQTASAITAPLAPGVRYYYRVLTENATGTAPGTLASFTVPLASTASTGEASEVTRTTAVVGGEVDPEGLEAHYYVQYGTGGALSRSAPAEPGFEAGSEMTVEALGTPELPAATLSELAPGTNYEYRLVATNADGTSYGIPKAFTTLPATPPVAETGAATGITQLSATITGTVYPQGLQITTLAFEFGSTPDLGSLELARIVSVSETDVRIEASFEPSLLPGTTYYYRTIASNRDGTGYGPLRSFVTGAFAEPPSPTTTSLLSFPTTPPPTITTKSTEKPTRAQKLVSALRACRRLKRKHKRAVCEKQAHTKYATTKNRLKNHSTIARHV